MLPRNSTLPSQVVGRVTPRMVRAPRSCTVTCPAPGRGEGRPPLGVQGNRAEDVLGGPHRVAREGYPRELLSHAVARLTRPRHDLEAGLAGPDGEPGDPYLFPLFPCLYCVTPPSVFT